MILIGTFHVEIVQDIHISKPVLIHIETHSIQTFILLRRTAIFNLHASTLWEHEIVANFIKNDL